MIIVREGRSDASLNSFVHLFFKFQLLFVLRFLVFVCINVYLSSTVRSQYSTWNTGQGRMLRNGVTPIGQMQKITEIADLPEAEHNSQSLIRVQIMPTYTFSRT